MKGVVALQLHCRALIVDRFQANYAFVVRRQICLGLVQDAFRLKVGSDLFPKHLYLLLSVALPDLLDDVANELVYVFDDDDDGDDAEDDNPYEVEGEEPFGTG